MTNPENNPSEFEPRQPAELTPEQARQANQTFLQGQGLGAAEQQGAQPQEAAGGAPQAQPAQPAPAITDPERGSFFGALFDFSFRRYVTPSVAQVLYMVLFIVIGVSGGVALLGAVSVLFSDQPFGVNLLLFVLAVPPIVLVTVAVLALCRVYLEVAVSLIRTSQSVQAIDARQEQRLRAMQQEQASQGASQETVELPGQTRIQPGPSQQNPGTPNEQ